MPETDPANCKVHAFESCTSSRVELGSGSALGVSAADRLDAVLREDPSGLYRSCDQRTLEQYRRAAREIGVAVALEPVEVALQAVAECKSQGGGETNDLGFYLIGPGRDALLRRLGVRATLRRRVARIVMEHRSPLYIGFAVTACLVVCAVTLMIGERGIGTVFLALLLSAPALQAGLTLSQHLLAPAIQPVLPAIDVNHLGRRCTVVIPVLVRSAEDIGKAVKTIILNATENPLAECDYWLATDFADSLEEYDDADEPLLAAIVEAIGSLRAEGISAWNFHRSRHWSTDDGMWVGWERKRGKLLDWAADPEVRSRIGDGLAVVLDVDAVLKDDGLRKLYAIAAHPLNRRSADGAAPVGIWQPDVRLKPARETRLANWIYDEEPPLDVLRPSFWEARFGWGMYFGKGLVDFRALETATAGAISDGSTLSHDHLEGLLVGVRYCGQVVIEEDAPQSWLGWKARQHRWIRGDAQLLPWIATGHDPRATRRVNLSLIARWRLWENCLSHLAPISGLLAICWCLVAFPTVQAAGFLLSVLLLLFAGDWLGFVFKLGKGTPGRGALAQRWSDAVGSLVGRLPTMGFDLLALPERACLALDAVSRALYRSFISRRKLLEWSPSGTERGPGSLAAHIVSGLPALCLLVLTVLLIAVVRPENLTLSLALIPWLAAPMIFWAATARPARSPQAPHGQRT